MAKALHPHPASRGGAAAAGVGAEASRPRKRNPTPQPTGRKEATIASPASLAAPATADTGSADPDAVAPEPGSARRRAYIGLGANQGDAVENLRTAIEAIRGIEGTAVADVSPFYRSAPIDAEGPDFVNAVAAIDTDLDPYGLLLHLSDIEIMLGRKRSTAPAAPNARKEARRIDLDLLLMESLIVRSDPLVLPHPRMHLRAFVLTPLLDLAPGIQIPGQGPAAGLLAHLEPQEIERLPGSGAEAIATGAPAGKAAT
ncbi:2-amino-4-hydroxy-6-hydroxymethyldihydropteridine pyrophosphokinase [Burkholderiales bacterium GJ-E10]|nr:2-amino-4-hydroxy-6-hydroxymethyldihydropteridine pyrophosphokinase [Burkholderiales bacterium GJ-E10]